MCLVWRLPLALIYIFNMYFFFHGHLARSILVQRRLILGILNCLSCNSFECAAVGFVHVTWVVRQTDRHVNELNVSWWWFRWKEQLNPSVVVIQLQLLWRSCQAKYFKKILVEMHFYVLGMCIYWKKFNFLWKKMF